MYAHSQGESEQKPMKNFGKSSRVHSQGVQKIFMAPIYGAHIARSSLRQHSFLVIVSYWTNKDGWMDGINSMEFCASKFLADEKKTVNVIVEVGVRRK